MTKQKPSQRKALKKIGTGSARRRAPHPSPAATPVAEWWHGKITRDVLWLESMSVLPDTHPVMVDFDKHLRSWPGFPPDRQAVDGDTPEGRLLGAENDLRRDLSQRHAMMLKDEMGARPSEAEPVPSDPNPWPKLSRWIRTLWAKITGTA